jgi:putative endonuclease
VRSCQSERCARETQRIGYTCRLCSLKSFGRGFDSRHLHQPPLKLRLASRSFSGGCPPERSEGGRSPAIPNSSKNMKYVYLLQSIPYPGQRYIGLTDDLQQRLAKHNEGGSPHTSKFAPWRIVIAVRFDNDQRAAGFERYLKTGSGRAFANRHLW